MLELGRRGARGGIDHSLKLGAILGMDAPHQ